MTLQPIDIPAVLEVSYGEPGDPPVWVDESAYLRGFSVDRGRSTERERTQAGQATIVLDNRTRRFDPTNIDSPHYPDVVPLRRVRLRAAIDDGGASFELRHSRLRDGHMLRGEANYEVPLFDGYVESWPQEWEGSGADARVILKAIDGFKVAAYGRFAETAIVGEAPGERVARVLDAIGWPAAERAVDPGSVELRGTPTVTENVDEPALTHLESVASSEGGTVFISADGKFTFHDADHTGAPDDTDLFGAGAGERRYKTIVVEYDDSQIWNDVEVTTEGETSGVASDATSITRYFRRTLVYPTLLMLQGERSARAAALVAQYKDPAFRVTRLTPRPDGPLDWLYVLRQELLDAIRVRKRPAAGGLIEQDSRIEGIRIMSPNAVEWDVQWELSGIAPAFLSRAFYLGAAASDLSGGDDFNRYLEGGPEAFSTVAFSILEVDDGFPGQNVRTSRAFTRASAVVGPSAAVDYLVGVDVRGVTNPGSIDFQVQVHRVNSAGTVQASSGLSNEQHVDYDDAVPVTLSFLVNADLGTFGATDRLRVDYRFENRSPAGTATVTIGVGTTASEVIVPIA